MVKNLAIAILFSLCMAHSGAQSKPPAPTPAETAGKSEANAAKAQKQADINQLKAKASPLGVEISQTAPLKVEATNKTEKHHEYTSSEWWLVYLTATLALVTTALALYTAKLYGATVNLGKEAKKGGATQADKMERSISEATRAATAMESVAEATKNNAILMESVLHKQMRAYIAVNTGKPAYQDENNFFAAEIIIENTGHTPARKLSYRIKAGVLPNDPDIFPDIPALIENDIGIAPRQKFWVNDIIRGHRFSDAEVKDIMLGATQRLFVWGTVFYEDIYGGKWETNFCHYFSWIFDKEGKIANRSDFYNKKHNSST